MKFRALLNILISYVLLFPAGVTNVGANTISYPVSVAVPTSVNGELDSKPVSVAVPTGMHGELDSKPVSVSYPFTSADGMYMGKPVTLAVNPENQGDPDLVGLWHMDGDWADSSGNNNNGAPVNAPAFTTDNHGGTQAVSFNGSSSFIQVADSASLDLTTAMTLEAWIKPGDIGNYRQIVSKFGSSGNYSYQFGLAPSGNLRVDISGTGTAYDNLATTTAPIIVNAWNHVAATFNAGVLNLYVNGIQAVQAKTSTITALKVSTTPLNLGRDPSGVQYFNGLTDEVAIYKRALTPEEIALHANAVPGDPAAPPSPILDPVPAVVGTSTITLSGSKTISTSIWVNNKKIAPLDNTAAWLGTYGTLLPGVNLLNIVAVDATFKQSSPVSKSVIYDNMPPVIESTYPANNSDTARPVTSVAINLTDIYSSINLDESRVDATIKNSDGQAVSGLWMNSGTKTIIFTPSTTPFPSDSYLVTIYPADAVGNKGQQQIAFTTHDTSAPITTLSLKETKGKDGWYSSAVTITLTASDGGEGSGIARIEYSLDGTSWVTYTSSFGLDTDGVNTLSYRSTDKSGNVEATKSGEIRINKTGLVGLWHMDNDWQDSSVIGNHATPYSGATFTSSAKIGTYAGSFDGVDDYAMAGAGSYAGAANTFTVMLWAYPTATRNVTSESNSGISGTSAQRYAVGPAHGGNNDAGVGISVGTNGISVFEHGSSYLPSLLVHNVSLAAWNHIAVVYENKQPRLYLNGQFVKTGLLSLRENVYASTTFGNVATYGPYKGSIDDVAIYNRALSDTEIQENYRSYSIQPPTVEPVQTPTTSSTITLSGSKPAETAIVVNGTTIVPLDSQTTWQASYTLQPGMNNLSFTAMDADGFHSQAVLVPVALDLSSPDVLSTDPVNNGLFNTSVGSIKFNLSEPFSTIDLDATLTGASVTKTSGADPSGTWATSGGGSTAAVTFTPDDTMTEGTYTATIHPTDLLGNRSSYSMTFTVDATPPPPPTIDPILVPSRTTTKTINGTKSLDSIKIIAACAGATVGAVSYPTALTWSVTVSGLDEGSNTVTAYAVDQAANPSPSAQMTFTVDTLPPAAPIVTPQSTPTKLSSITLAGTKEAGSYLFVNNVKTGAAYGDSAWSYPVNLTSEGNNAFVVFAQDEAGNPSQSVTVNVVRDTTAPRISSTTPSINGFTNQLASIDIVLVDDNSGVDLQASIQNNEVTYSNNTVISGSWTTQAGGHIVFTPDPGTVLGDGVYTVKIKPVDQLETTITLTFSFTLDTGLPTVQSLTMSPTSPHKTESVQFSITFNEPMSTTIDPSVSFVKSSCLIFCTITPVWTGKSWSNYNKTWNGSHTFSSGTGDGTYTVNVSGAQDIAGNVMTSAATGTFVLDTTPPASPGLDNVTTPTNNRNQILKGARELGSAIYINGTQRVAADPNPTTGEPWSYSYPLSEGTNALSITARDAAGNNSVPTTAAIVLDTTPPTFTVNTYQNPSSVATQTLTGTKEPGCIVKLGDTQLYGPADISDTWSYDANLISSITNRYVFTAADALGNTTTRTVDILYDTAPPAPLGPGVLIADGSGNGTEATLSWTAYPETPDVGYYVVYQSLSVFGDVAGMIPIGTVNNGTRTYTATALTQGTTYYFAVVPVDQAGNQIDTVNIASAVPTDTKAPEDVTNLAAAADYADTQGNFIAITWNASLNSTNDLADHIVYVDGGTGYDTGTPLGKTAATYTKTGLSDATKYKFKITVKDTLGHESRGAVVEAVTRLANPTNLTAATSSGKAALSWSAVSSPYVKQYNIYSKPSTAQLTSIGTMTLVGNVAKTATTYNATGLTNDTTYQYAVTVLNTSGAERSDVQSISVTPLADSTGPAIDTFSIITGQVVTGPITITATAYDVESTMGSMELSIDGTVVATQNGGSLSYFWNVVAATDGNHTIKLRATDSKGNATEDPRQVIVSLAQPASPKITGHSETQTTPSYIVTATGTAPLFTTVTLKVNGVVVNTAQTAGTTGTGTFTFPSIALVEGDNVLAVKASHRGGESAYAPDYKILVDTGAPPAPQNLAAQVLTGGLLRFTWTSPTGEMPSGYNLYMSPSSFSSKTDAGVTATNTSPITYQYKEYNPGDDGFRYYAVTALDSAGNESGISNVAALSTDGTAPSVATIQYKQNSQLITPNSAVGPGSVEVAVTVSEKLKELPFFSLEPQEGSPIVVTMNKVDDTHYDGAFTITAQSPQGATTYKFSGKDMVGNRGNGQGAGITIDVKGPEAAVQSPAATLQIKSDPAAVAVILNEASVVTPEITLKGSDGTTSLVSGMTSTDNGIHWAGSLNVSSMPEGKAEFIMNSAQDTLGNVGTIVSTGRYILLYRDQVPSPGIPDGLAAKSEKAGAVTLTWYPVMYEQLNNIGGSAITYNVYRRAENESSPTKVITGSAGSPAQDTPPDDGTYYYAITSVGLMGSESPLSAEVQAVSDRTGPPAPQNLSLSLGSGGVSATWDAVVDSQSVLPLKGYHLYRSNAAFTSSTGLTPVAKVPISTAVDASPSKTYRFYAVAAVDSLGNEGLLSEIKEIDFPVSPVRNLVLQRIDDAAPTITWQSPQDGTIAGYHIYRNGSRVTPYPVLDLSYTDGYGASNTTYGVSAVDNLENESPVKEVALPDLTLGLKEGTTLRRGVLETVPIIISLASGFGLSIDSIDVKVGTAPASTILGPFSLAANTTLQLEKVAATTADALSPVSVFIQANWSPSPGVAIKLSRTTSAEVQGSSSSMEVFNDPLVRNTDAKVRLKVNNIGTSQMELVTSENNTKTTKVRINLKDQDGNLLSTGYLDQRVGASIVNGAGYAVARINPNESFMTDPILLPVPVSAPYKVIIEAVIENTYYHYSKSDQVTAPGMKGSVESYIQETAYRAVAAPEKTFYAMGQPVIINGSAISNTPSTLAGEGGGEGALVPNVPVKLGISVNGFDRFYTVTTDASGNFTYTFTPGSNEAGSYNLWAVHPDVKDRTVQATFSIAGISINPTSATVRLARNRSLDIPVTISNFGGGALTGLAFETTSSSGISVGVINNGDTTLTAGEKQSTTLRLTADTSAPDTGWATMKATTTEGLSVTLNASITMVSLSPIISTSPSYIDTGMVRGDQKIATFTITNTGEDTLKNARMEGPSTSWMSLTQDKTIGDIAPGSSKSVSLMFMPSSTLAQGVYDDQIVIYSDNHIPYTYHIQVTVSSNAVGSVYFTVQNILAEKTPNATITFQHQLLRDLIYTVNTAADGTAIKNDIPEGRYSFSVTPPPGHLPYSGTFVISPGITTTASIILEVKLVDVTWSVVPTTIQDKYEIVITQTFATNVPLPVLVTEPPVINLPEMQPGQVFNGEFTITNYGLIAVVDVKIAFPISFLDYDVEVLTSSIPTRIGAQQKITMPFRVTRRQQIASNYVQQDAGIAACNPDFSDQLFAASTLSSLFEEVRGFGAGCVSSFPITASGTAETCPVSGATASASTSGNVGVPTTCPTGGGGSGTGGGSGGGWYGGGGGSSGGSGGGAPGQPGPLPTGDCGCMNCDDHSECTTDSCSAGVCLHEPVVCPPSTDCQESFCNSASGCDTRNKPDGTSCKDEPNKCTQDVCQGGGCSHPQKDCSDEYECTIDSCDAETGCKHEFLDEMPDDPTDCVNKYCGPDGAIVTDPDDGEAPADPCYICKNGSPQPKDCDDHIECSEDSCENGSCVNTFLDEMPDDLTDCVNKMCGPNGSIVIEADDGEDPPQGPNNDCLQYKCENKISVPKPNPNETPPQASEHDCRTDVCTDHGQDWIESGEVPLNECKECQGGNEVNKSDGPLSPDDPTDCVDKSCIEGVLQTVADNDEDPPQGPNNDCLQYKCENKISVPKPNPNETPPQASEHDCRTDVCTDHGQDWIESGEVPLNECKECQGGNEVNKSDGPLSPDDLTDCVDKSCLNGNVEIVSDNNEVPTNPCKKCDDGKQINKTDCEKPCEDPDACCIDGNCTRVVLTSVDAKANGSDETNVFVNDVVILSSQPQGENCEYQYFWRFGDGETSISANPTHSYQSEGIYYVQVQVWCSKCSPPEKSDTVKVNVCNEIPNAEVISVDARDPYNVQVNYTTSPSDASFDTVVFEVGGIAQTKTNVSGNFSFSFDESILPLGSTTINLKATKCKVSKTSSISVNRIEKRGPTENEIAFGKIMITENGSVIIVTIPVNHDLFEIWHVFEYSVPTIAGSKAVWIGRSSVNIKTTEDQYGFIPTEIGTWSETHYYGDNEGTYLQQYMNDSGLTLPPQGPNFKSKDSNNNGFFKAGNGLAGYATISNIQIYSDGEGMIPWIPVINTTVDKLLD